jgi:hypothetical protein
VKLMAAFRVRFILPALAVILAMGCTSHSGGSSVPSPAPSLPDPFAPMPLAASWSSKTIADRSVRSMIPDDGHGLRVRGKCQGSGTVRFMVHGADFSFDDVVECSGQWQAEPMGFPAIGGDDPGPYPIEIDVQGDVTFWEVEARKSMTTHTVPPKSLQQTGAVPLEGK